MCVVSYRFNIIFYSSSIKIFINEEKLQHKSQGQTVFTTHIHIQHKRNCLFLLFYIS